MTSKKLVYTGDSMANCPEMSPAQNVSAEHTNEGQKLWMADHRQSDSNGADQGTCCFTM